MWYFCRWSKRLLLFIKSSAFLKERSQLTSTNFWIICFTFPFLSTFVNFYLNDLLALSVGVNICTWVPLPVNLYYELSADKISSVCLLRWFYRSCIGLPGSCLGTLGSLIIFPCIFHLAETLSTCALNLQIGFECFNWTWHFDQRFSRNFFKPLREI